MTTEERVYVEKETALSECGTLYSAENNSIAESKSPQPTEVTRLTLSPSDYYTIWLFYTCIFSGFDQTTRANTMTKLCIRMFAKIHFELTPRPFIIPNVVTV